MAITVTKAPNAYSFAGNPVVFEVSTDSSEPVGVEISIGGKIYSTVYYPFLISENSYEIDMNLSDFLQFENQVAIPENEIISVIDGFAQPYQVKIGSEYVFNGVALRGGISNQAYKELEENGYNIFTLRLLLYYYQFLFTTRTNGAEIKIRESELYPFIFIHPGVPIVFKTETGDEIITLAHPEGTICAMNIQSVLTQMPEGTRRIDIYISGITSFHFTILPGKLSEEKYRLRFRNSLGAFEMLEVTGRAMHTPEFAEENLWQTLTELDFYEERRSRVKSKGIIEVETGYRERDEFSFILDLIQSDEIYFIYPDGDSFRCHVKADNAQYRNRMTEPTSINLKVTPVLEEEFVLPKIKAIVPLPPITKVDIIISDDYNKVFNLAFSDSTSLIDWGDGSPLEQSIVAFGATGNRHTYVNGNYTITVYNLFDIPKNFCVSQQTMVGLFMAGDINSIGESAFWQNQNLNNVIFPKSIKSIGMGAFAYNPLLVGELHLYNIDSIGYRAFQGTNITTIYLEDSCTIKEISDSCFASCRKLNSVRLCKSITTLAKHCFDDCILLSIINLDVDDTPNLRIIGEYAIAGNILTGNRYKMNLSSLESLSFHDYSIAFLDLSDATITDLPGQVLAGLLPDENSLLLPASLQSMSLNNLVYSNVRTHHIKLLATLPPSLHDTQSGNSQGLTVHVPQSALAAYQTNPDWNGTNYNWIILQGF